MKKLLKFKNLMDLLEAFPTEQSCIQYLINVRHNGKIVCPHSDCKCEKVYAFKDGKTFKCAECKKRFSVRVGSIFQDSNIPLRKWFMAIYLITNHKKGISSVQLSKDIGVTQKSSWFMLHRLRHANKTKSFEFQGTVEADECYVGGSESNKHTQKKFTAEKAVIFGLVNRETKQVKSFNVESADKECLLPKIGCNIKMGSTIVTDSYHAYKDLKNNYKHDVIKHSAGEYVRIDTSREAFKIHTNTIEGYWALVKRTINGTYHWVSKKHLQKYLIECDFRYNTKEFEVESQRFDCFLQNKASKLSYKKLIA
jgi:transposase-like protein